MTNSRRNSESAKRLLTRLASLLSGLASKGLGIPPGLEVISTFLFNNTLDAICDDPAAATKAKAIYAEVLAKSAKRDVKALKEAILKVAGLLPQYKDELSRLQAIVDDPDGIQENQLLIDAICKLFERTSVIEEPNVMGQLLFENPEFTQTNTAIEDYSITVQDKYHIGYINKYYSIHIDGFGSKDDNQSTHLDINEEEILNWVMHYLGGKDKCVRENVLKNIIIKSNHKNNDVLNNNPQGNQNGESHNDK